MLGRPRRTRQLVRYRRHRRQKTEGVTTTRLHHVIVCCCLPAGQVKHLSCSTWGIVPPWATGVKPRRETMCMQKRDVTKHKLRYTPREQRWGVYHATPSCQDAGELTYLSPTIPLSLPRHHGTHGSRGGARAWYATPSITARVYLMDRQ